MNSGGFGTIDVGAPLYRGERSAELVWLRSEVFLQPVLGRLGPNNVVCRDVGALEHANGSSTTATNVRHAAAIRRAAVCRFHDAAIARHEGDIDRDPDEEDVSRCSLGAAKLLVVNSRSRVPAGFRRHRDSPTTIQGHEACSRSDTTMHVGPAVALDDRHQAITPTWRSDPHLVFGLDT